VLCHWRRTALTPIIFWRHDEIIPRFSADSARPGGSGSAHAFLGLFSQNEALKAENGQVSIPLSQVSDGKAHHFSFEDQGVELKFFVVKSSDGVVRAAFDACDVCFREKKGYSQDKDFMVCNNCGCAFIPRASTRSRAGATLRPWRVKSTGMRSPSRPPIWPPGRGSFK
jgi:Predicted membrane protein